MAHHSHHHSLDSFPVKKSVCGPFDQLLTEIHEPVLRPCAVRRRLRGDARPTGVVGGDAEQVARDNTEPDGAGHAAGPVVATPLQVMSALEHPDASLRAYPPAHPPSGPALAFVGPSGRRFLADPRQHHAADTSCRRDGLIGCGAVATSRGREVWGPAEMLLLRVEGAHSQGAIRRPLRVDVVHADDLPFGLTNRDQCAELRGLDQLALANRSGVRFEDMRILSQTCVSLPSTRARVCASTRPANGRR